jgi:hypothetical protein
MLKTVQVSSNKKTGPIAVTYRSGNSDIFGTCPKTCGLLPKGRQGAAEIDTEYMRAVQESVPRGGKAWTYSHFDAESLPYPEEGKTVINASCDSMDSAVRAHSMGRPAVYAAPVGTEWAGGVEHKGVKFVRCPAELSDEFTCHDCGNGSPLCARGNRDYVVVFVAHGPSKKRVGTGEGGCYGSSGPVAIQWHKTRETGAPNDGEALRAFARSLPRGSLLRHHVVGDMGAAC